MAFSYGNIWHSPDKYELSTTTWSSLQHACPASSFFAAVAPSKTYPHVMNKYYTRPTIWNMWQQTMTCSWRNHLSLSYEKRILMMRKFRQHFYKQAWWRWRSCQVGRWRWSRWCSSCSMATGKMCWRAGGKTCQSCCTGEAEAGLFRKL